MTLLLNQMMVHGIHVGGMLKNKNNIKIVAYCGYKFFSLIKLYGI